MAATGLSATVWCLGDATPWVSAAFGLIGTVVGGAIAGGISLKAAADARRSAEQAWVRDSRRQIYDRFLTSGQALLAAMEKATASRPVGVEDRLAVDECYSVYVGAYASVQTVAEMDVVLAARAHTYRLQALKDILDGKAPDDRGDFRRIAKSVRDARHDTIDAMRRDLGFHDSARPPEGTDYAKAVADATREDGSVT